MSKFTKLWLRCKAHFSKRLVIDYLKFIATAICISFALTLVSMIIAFNPIKLHIQFVGYMISYLLLIFIAYLAVCISLPKDEGFDEYIRASKR